MAKTLRIGFVGSGGMTQAHTGAMAGFKDVQFAAFCDVRKERAQEWAAKYCGAEGFTSVGKMLEQADLDAVWLNLPPFAHGEAEEACLAHQTPFFVEKPINGNVKQAAKIAAAVAKAGLLTCAGYMNRYRKSAETAKKLLADGSGTYAWGGWLGGAPRNPDPNTITGWWVQKDKSGGQFVEQVTHTMDLVRYLLGDAESVSAFAARGFNVGIPNYTIDDALAVSVKFKSGAVGNFCASTSAGARGGVYLNVYGLNCTCNFTGWDHSVEIWEPGKKKPKQVSGNPADGSHIFAVEDAAFLKAVRTGKAESIRTTYADALKTLELTVAATESAEAGGKVIKLKY